MTTADEQVEYTEEEWVVARALSTYTTLEAELLLPEARLAIAALDDHRKQLAPV